MLGAENIVNVSKMNINKITIGKQKSLINFICSGGRAKTQRKKEKSNIPPKYIYTNMTYIY